MYITRMLKKYFKSVTAGSSLRDFYIADLSTAFATSLPYYLLTKDSFGALQIGASTLSLLAVIYSLSLIAREVYKAYSGKFSKG